MGQAANSTTLSDHEAILFQRQKCSCLDWGQCQLFIRPGVWPVSASNSDQFSILAALAKMLTSRVVLLLIALLLIGKQLACECELYNIDQDAS